MSNDANSRDFLVIHRNLTINSEIHRDTIPDRIKHDWFAGKIIKVHGGIPSHGADYQTARG